MSPHIFLYFAVLAILLIFTLYLTCLLAIAIYIILEEAKHINNLNKQISHNNDMMFNLYMKNNTTCLKYKKKIASLKDTITDNTHIIQSLNCNLEAIQEECFQG